MAAVLPRDFRQQELNKMETTSRKIANAIFAFFVTEFEYKTCMLCGESHHVLTMRKVGDGWICNHCNRATGVLYDRYAAAASMLAAVRM